MAKITKIILHHTGGTVSDRNASTQHHSADTINMYHKKRWEDFRSSLGYWGGYTFFIEKNGKITQFRAIGEEGAHTIGSNSDSVGICLAGNFSPHSPDRPTREQTETMLDIIEACRKGGAGYVVKENTVINISLSNIAPHRVFHKNHTECNGMALSDNWARELLLKRQNKPIEPEIPSDELLLSRYQQLLLLYMQLLDILKRTKPLGGINGRGCELLPDYIYLT